MEQFSIKYGGSDLSLTKSRQFVAVRAARGRVEQASNSIERCQGTCTGQSFQGFLLAEVDDEVRPMEDTLEALRSDSNIDVGTHVYHTSDDGIPFVPTGEVFVQFGEGSSDRERQKAIDQLNASLPRFATVKKFTILPRELSQEAGEITPSQKVKRKLVEQRYKAELDAMYRDPLA